MPVTVMVRVVHGGLRCVNSAEASTLEELVGQEVEARIFKAVNPQFRRKYFALLKTAFDMADFLIDGEPGNFEQFRHAVTTGAGWCDFIQYSDFRGDKIIAVPRSIQWAKMDDAEFQGLFRDSLTYICQTWVLDEQQLDRIVQFM